MSNNLIEEIKKDPEAAKTFTYMGKGHIKTYRLNDVGNSERLIDKYGDIIRYVGLWGKWIYYEDGHWIIDDKYKIEYLSKATIKSIYGEAQFIHGDDERIALIKHANKSESARAITNMIQLSRSDPRSIITPDDVDRDPFLLNCPDGTIELLKAKKREHDKRDLITKICPVVYDPQAEFVEWAKFLHKIFNKNEELIGFIQRAVGYSLTGSTKEQCLFILYGAGANGKSTFLEVLRLLFNDYAQQTPIETFLMRDNNANSNDLARLKGARLVTASEIGEGRRLNESLVKQVTGGDKLTARFLHKEFFEFTPQFKLWIATNHKPTIRGTDNGIWRRIRLIPFEITIPPKEQDRDLISKLKSELPGILNWALIGCLEWQKNGLNPPKDVVNATDSYRNEMDILASFIDDCTVSGSDFRSKLTDMYGTYVKWCKLNGENELTQIKFGTRLMERGFEKKRGTGGTWFWHGIGLKVDEAEFVNDNPFS